MAPIRYKAKPTSVINTYSSPVPAARPPKNRAAPMPTGRATSCHCASLELPLRTITDQVQKNSAISRTSHQFCITPAL